MRLAALALLPLAGCDLVFEINVPDLCRTAGPFIEPQAIAGMPDESLFDPTLRDDGLELFFTRSIAAAGYDIFVAQRATVDDPFGPAAPLAFDTLQNESDAQITADGLHLLFMQDNELFEAVRERRDIPFTGAQPRTDIDAGPGIDGFDVSADGLTVYYTRDDLLVAHRPTLVSPFGPASVIGPRMEYPSISHSELELFFQNTTDQQIYRVTRSSREAMFDGAPEPLFLGEDPEISDDGQQLLFRPVAGTGLSIVTRNCVE